MLPRILNLVFNVLPVQQGSQDFSRDREIPRTVDDWKNLVMANMHTLFVCESFASHGDSFFSDVVTENNVEAFLLRRRIVCNFNNQTNGLVRTKNTNGHRQSHSLVTFSPSASLYRRETKTFALRIFFSAFTL